MAGKKRQRAVGEENDSPKKPKQTGDMQGQEITREEEEATVTVTSAAALPASSLALFSPPPRDTSVGKETIKTEEETPLFQTQSAGAEESSFSVAAKIIMNTNGEENVSDESKDPDPPQMNDSASHVVAPADTNTAKSSRVRTVFLFLMYASLMASFVFAGLWIVDYVQTTEQTQAQLEHDFLDAKDMMQRLQNDLNSWMGHARLLEQQNRDLAGGTQEVQTVLDDAMVLVRELEEQKLAVMNELEVWMNHARNFEQHNREIHDDCNGVRKALEDSTELVSQIEGEKQSVSEEVTILRRDLENWMEYARDLENRHRELQEGCERRLSEMGGDSEQQQQQEGELWKQPEHMF